MSVVTVPTSVEAVLAPSRGTLRPRFEGTNIGTWIGFKHINYLVEEALVEHFRSAGAPVGALYRNCGVGFEIVHLDTRIISALHIDDLATYEVVPSAPVDGELAVRVVLSTDRDGENSKVATSKVRVVLRDDARAKPTAELPAELRPFLVSRIGATSPAPATIVAEGRTDADVLTQLTRGRNAYAHAWRIPYFYCHYTERLQMSGYLRVMEEVVDLFLGDRGLSIRNMLDSRDWIPACTHSRIRMVDEALMEETLYVVYTVEEIFKDFLYTSSMECYVLREDRLVPTATGVVTHGYAAIDDRTNWGLVPFDAKVHAAFRGEQR
ncbi:thioesterase [Actinoplanes sp. LDG1-06]|uniref:Thioesterase n=1 Tax=Paractinoplanes ovalisporus TaxID=2810368 RepID=A0ABS2AI63_9ACTN|nr:thioesterase [Actinoplanes ovalisporus]MBM2619527.1 thioesterase [Actinoplanes ovalisporus]